MISREALLAALTLATWWGFLRLLRRGRATTHRELILELTIDTSRVEAAVARAGAAFQDAARAFRLLAPYLEGCDFDGR